MILELLGFGDSRGSGILGLLRYCGFWDSADSEESGVPEVSGDSEDLRIQEILEMLELLRF